MTPNDAELPAPPSHATSAAAPVLLIAALLAFVFLAWIPHHFLSFSSFDSGIFLYVGEQLRNGHHLYRDVWDHKPPLIFLFNEIGLAIGAGSPGGVFLLDYCCCAVFFVVSYRELRKLFAAPAAFLAICFGVLFFRDSAPQPNLGEVLSLPFQVAAFLLLVRDQEHGVSLVRAASQAVLLALLFWTKPSGIAISLLYLLVTLATLVPLRKPVFLVQWALTYIAAAVAASAIIAIPFAISASWHDVWFATITFNQLYANLTTLGDRLRALWWLIQFSAGHGVILLAGAGLVAILFRRPLLASARHRVLLLGAAWLMIEFLFAAYTGKQYGKNLIPATLPVMLLIAGFFDSLVNRAHAGPAIASLKSAAAIVFCFTLALSFSQFRENRKASLSPDERLVSEVQKLSSPTELSTFWGVFPPETVFAAHRASGTRFFCSIPLSHGEPLYRLLAPLSLDDLEHTQPKFIIQRDDGEVPPLVGQGTSGWDTAALAQQKARLMQLYHPVWSDPASATVIFEHH